MSAKAKRAAAIRNRELDFEYRGQTLKTRHITVSCLELTESGAKSVAQRIGKLLKKIEIPVLISIRKWSRPPEGDSCYWSNFYMNLRLVMPQGRYFALVAADWGAERMRISFGAKNVFTSTDEAKSNYHEWRTV